MATFTGQCPNGAIFDSRITAVPPSFPLCDGSLSWEQVYTAATGVWNAVTGDLQLTTTISPEAILGAQDGINEAYFGTNIAGYNLQPNWGIRLA